MGRLTELKDVRAKIDAEIEMLRGGPIGGDVNQARTMAPEAQCAREKTPDEIINELFTYHPPDFVQTQQYDTIRDAAKHLAMVIWKNCPYGADRTAAIRKLRETVMTANAAIALRGLSV